MERGEGGGEVLVPALQRPGAAVTSNWFFFFVLNAPRAQRVAALLARFVQKVLPILEHSFAKHSFRQHEATAFNKHVFHGEGQGLVKQDGFNSLRDGKREIIEAASR